MPGNFVRFTATLKDDVSKGLAGIDKKFDSLSKSKGANAFATGFGIAGGIGAFNLATTALSGLTDVVSGSIKSASDLNEQIGKSQQVFGASAQSVIAFGDTTAKAIGISKVAALEAAGNFGNMFNTIGLATDASAKMSTQLVTLAADLGAMNNIDDTNLVLDKLRSGLTGEAEPLRTMGILINETTVAAKAQELGFKKVNGQFTEGEKVQARYALILEQSAAAQGNFALTSGNMAEQQKVLNAELEDTSAKLGQKFVPVVEKTQKALITGEPVLEGFIDVLGALPFALTHGGNSMEYFIEQNHDAQLAQAGLANQTIEATLALQGSADSFDRQAIRVTDSTKDLTAATKDGSSAFDDLAGNINKAEDALSDYYGEASTVARSAVLADRLASDEKALRDLKKQYADNKISTREYKEKLHELTVGILEDKDAIVDNLVEQAKMGKKGPLDAFLARQLANWQHLTDQQRLALQYALRYASATFGVDRSTGLGGGKGGSKHAAGGFVPPGQMGTVGEEGTEGLITLPGGGAVVIPHRGSSGGGGGWGGGVTLVYSPTYSSASSAEAERFMRAILPQLTREMRRQSIL